MVALDTSGLLAALIETETHREGCAAAPAAARGGPKLLSPFVLAELDYPLMVRHGVDVELGFLEDVADGAYELVPMTSEQVGRSRAITERHLPHRLRPESREEGVHVADTATGCGSVPRRRGARRDSPLG